MTTNKKLVVTVGVMAVALILALTGIIVVLVNANQRASSAVNVKYTSSDVAVTLSATAYLGSNSHVFTKGGVVGGETELVLSPTVTEGSLSQTSDIASFDLTKSNDYVVFEYVFANNTDTIDVKIDQDGIPATKENINLTYTYSDTQIQSASFKTLEGEAEFTAQLLPAYENEETVKYVYIKAQIADLLYDSSLIGDFGWVLSKPNEADINTVTLSVANADYIEREGTNLSSSAVTNNYSYRTLATTVNTEDIGIYPAVANKRFVGWSETEGGTVISAIEMPSADITHNVLRGTTAKTLYPVYKDANLPTKYYTLDNGSFVFNTKVTEKMPSELVIADIYNDGTTLAKVTRIGSETDWSGDQLFTLTTSPTSVILGRNITKIGYQSFAYSAIQEITFSDKVSSFGSYVFKQSSLTKIIIPASLTSIGLTPFFGCNALTSIVVEDGNPKYDSRDNCNAIISTSSNSLMQACVNTTIPETVTRIDLEAYEGLMVLTNVYIPKNVTYIESWAFNGCSGLLGTNGGSGITFEDPENWTVNGPPPYTAIDLSNPLNNAKLLVSDAKPCIFKF